MALSREEATERISELEDMVQEKNQQLLERPERTVVEVEEVITSNSSQSDSLGALALALSKAQGEFKAVNKGAKGYGYNFADLASILSYAQPIYTKHGLSIAQLSVSKLSGKTVLAGVKTILMHESGEWLSSEMYQPALKTKQNNLSQNIGIINSYFRRYMVQSILGLATEDKDGRDD